MGASSSTDHKVSAEQRELESLAASTGALPLLRRSFSKLVDSQTNTLPIQSLEQCFCLSYKSPTSEAQSVPDSFLRLLDHLGSSLVDLFFVPAKGGLDWVEFARGYVKCCGRMSASMACNTLLRLYAVTAKNAGLSLKLQFESDEADCKINGYLLPIDVLMLLWMCWTMSWDSRVNSSTGQANLYLPDVSHLLLSAVVSCAESGDALNVWDSDVYELEVELPVVKFLTWTFTTIPSFTECLTQFVNAKLQNSSTVEDKSESSNSDVRESSASKAYDNTLLTCGKAWAISLTCRNAISEEILKIRFSCDSNETQENLLYRSSIHGKGMNRFWSNIEGYHGPLLILVSASCGDTPESGSNERKWVICVLTQQGFENQDTFYGSSGNLFALSPVFHAFCASGKEKNFVYSHLHPTGRVYEAYPKPVGVGFGGTAGNERVFLDEDFARITIRHHAVDKTYQPGSLIPNQGFLPVEASILEVEAWGLGGKTAREIQASYRKREELFTEQRRKVDLKTFASWEDSPEKMMMDMVSNPNTVRREER